VFKDISQVGKHSVIYGLGQALQRLGSFLLVPIYTSHFTPSEFGVQEILTNTSSILTTLLGLGLVSGMYRSYFMYQDEQKRHDVVKSALVTFILFSLLTGGILLLASHTLSSLLLPDRSYWPLMVLTILWVVLTNIIAVPYATLRARTQSARFVIFSLAQFLVNSGATILLVVIGGRGVRGSLEGNLLGQAAVLLLFLPLLVHTMRARFSTTDLKEMLSFGLPLVPAMLASTSMTVSDRYFLRAFATFDEIGVYGLGYKIGLVTQLLIVTPFMLSWGPVMWAVAKRRYAQQFYAKVLTYFAATALYVALGLSVLSPEAVRLLSQREAYWRAWQVVPLVALSYVLYGFYYQLAVGLNLEKKMKYIPVIVSTAAAVNLLLNYVLIPPWGMMGAAISTLASYSLLSVLAYFASRRFYPVAYEWGRLAQLLVIFGSTYLLSRLVPPSPLARALVFKIALLLLCPLILYAIRFLTPEELTRGRQLLSTGWHRLATLFYRFPSFWSRN
jgi:O-antigen/teichoic acid export membrane protein